MKIVIKFAKEILEEIKKDRKENPIDNSNCFYGQEYEYWLRNKGNGGNRMVNKMTQEKYDKIPDDVKEFFAKPGEEVKPLSDYATELLESHTTELLELLEKQYLLDMNKESLHNFGFDANDNPAIMYGNYTGKKQDINSIKLTCDFCDDGIIDYSDDFNQFECKKCHMKYDTSHIIEKLSRLNGEEFV